MHRQCAQGARGQGPSPGPAVGAVSQARRHTAGLPGAPGGVGVSGLSSRAHPFDITGESPRQLACPLGSQSAGREAGPRGGQRGPVPVILRSRAQRKGWTLSPALSTAGPAAEPRKGAS